jgi:hypothetical protein
MVFWKDNSRATGILSVIHLTTPPGLIVNERSALNLCACPGGGLGSAGRQRITVSTPD